MAYYRRRWRRGMGDAEADATKACINAGGSFASCMQPGSPPPMTQQQACIAGGGSPASCASIGAGHPSGGDSGGSWFGDLMKTFAGGAAAPYPGAYPGYPPGMYPPGYGQPGMSPTMKIALVGGAALAAIMILRK